MYKIYKYNEAIDLIDLYSLYRKKEAIPFDTTIVAFAHQLADDQATDKVVQMWIARDNNHEMTAVAGALEEFQDGTVHCHIRWFDTPIIQRYKLFLKGINKFQTELERKGYRVRFSIDKHDEGNKLHLKLVEKNVLSFIGEKGGRLVFKKRGKK